MIFLLENIDECLSMPSRQTRMVHILSIVRTVHTGCEHERKREKLSDIGRH